jgi:hypothetical protein
MVSVADPENLDYVVLPTGTAFKDRFGGRLPVRLVQKLVIVHPSLLIGWSGRLVFGAWACNHLRELCKEITKVELSLFERLFTDLCNECSDEDAFFLSYLHEESYKCILRHKNVWWDHHEELLDVFLAGSGGLHLKDAIERLGAVDSAESAVQYAMLLVSTMIEREIASGTSTEASYGGAWEVVSIEKGAFCKLNPVLYSQWRVKIEEEEYEVGFEYIMCLKYFDDRLRLKTIVTTPPRKLCVIYYEIGPPDRRPRHLTTDPFPSEAPNHAMALKYSIAKDSGKVMYHICVGAGKDKQPFYEVNFSPDSSNREFIYQDQIHEMVRKITGD